MKKKSKFNRKNITENIARKTTINNRYLTELTEKIDQKKKSNFNRKK